MTFKSFLKKKLANEEYYESPEMDFAKDVMHDKGFLNFKTWKALRLYLWGKSACREAVEAAEICWKDYKQELKANPAPPKPETPGP